MMKLLREQKNLFQAKADSLKMLSVLLKNADKALKSRLKTQTALPQKQTQKSKRRKMKFAEQKRMLSEKSREQSRRLSVLFQERGRRLTLWWKNLIRREKQRICLPRLEQSSRKTSIQWKQMPTQLLRNRRTAKSINCQGRLR